MVGQATWGGILAKFMGKGLIEGCGVERRLIGKRSNNEEINRIDGYDRVTGGGMRL
jgi:hypothetical protein